MRTTARFTCAPKQYRLPVAKSGIGEGNCVHIELIEVGKTLLARSTALAKLIVLYKSPTIITSAVSPRLRILVAFTACRLSLMGR